MPVALTAPLVLTAVKIPTLVILGCAASVTVAAVVAEPAVPELVANVALATVPVTLAPVILVSNDPLPITYPAVTLPVVEIELEPKLANKLVTLAFE